MMEKHNRYIQVKVGACRMNTFVTRASNRIVATVAHNAPMEDLVFRLGSKIILRLADTNKAVLRVLFAQDSDVWRT